MLVSHWFTGLSVYRIIGVSESVYSFIGLSGYRVFCVSVYRSIRLWVYIWCIISIPDDRSLSILPCFCDLRSSWNKQGLPESILKKDHEEPKNWEKSDKKQAQKFEHIEKTNISWNNFLVTSMTRCCDDALILWYFDTTKLWEEYESKTL